MKSVYPKLNKVMSAYAFPKIETPYTKTVKGYQFQGHYGNKGKFYGRYASKINPFKGGDKK